MNNRKGEISEINKLIAQFLDDVAKDFSEYSNIRPQGVPVVYRQNIDFKSGNVRDVERYSYSVNPGATDEREPLIDVIENGGRISVLVEMAGINKKEIKLTGARDKLRVVTKSHVHDIKLPSRVDPKSAIASFRGGVLEVTFNKSTNPNHSSEIRFND